MQCSWGRCSYPCYLFPSQKPQLFQIISISTIPFFFFFFYSFFFCFVSAEKRMEVFGCLGKVLANGTRNFPLDTDRDTHPATIVGRNNNNNNGLSCQPSSLSLYRLPFSISISSEERGGPNEFLFYDDGPFSLCRFIASIKRTFKKNKNPAETHSETSLFTTQLLDDERARGAGVDFRIDSERGRRRRRRFL